jgi:hypothetical protein
MIISTAFSKFQYHFMVKAVRILVLEGTYLNITMFIYKKPIINLILNGGKS